MENNKKIINRVMKAIKIPGNNRPILDHALIQHGSIVMTDLEDYINIEYSHKFDGMVHRNELEKAHKLNIDPVMSENEISDFPVVPRFIDAPGDCVNVSVKDLLDISGAVSEETTRWAIQGVAVYKNGSLAATDGGRLHVQCPEGISDKPLFILRSKTIKILKALGLNFVKFYKDKNSYNIAISFGFGSMVSLTLAGKFPLVKDLIKTEKDNNSLCPTGAIIEKIKTIKKLSKKNDYPRIKFYDEKMIWDDKVILKSEKFKNLDHIYNALYLLEALEYVSCDYIAFPKDKDKPINIIGKNRRAILMPIINN